MRIKDNKEIFTMQRSPLRHFSVRERAIMEILKENGKTQTRKLSGVLMLMGVKLSNNSVASTLKKMEKREAVVWNRETKTVKLNERNCNADLSQ